MTTDDRVNGLQDRKSLAYHQSVPWTFVAAAAAELDARRLRPAPKALPVLAYNSWPCRKSRRIVVRRRLVRADCHVRRNCLADGYWRPMR